MPDAASAVGAAGAAFGTHAGSALSTATSDPKVVEIGGLVMPKPVAWIWQRPTMQFRTLQYEVPAPAGASPAAELIFSLFPSGGAGPIDANIERWINQFRAGSAEDPVTQRTELEIDGLRVIRIDLRGAYMGMGAAAPRPQTAQLGAIVEAPGANVFIRLLGPEATVESARADFDTMIAGIRRAASPVTNP